MTLPNEIDLSTTGLIEYERVLVKDRWRVSFKLYRVVHNLLLGGSTTSASLIPNEFYVK
jgi:hypothetical protein